jgi:maleate cis-trans isomerase
MAENNQTYTKPERWHEAKNTLFPYQVGFTSPPHDFDAAPSDFLRISADNVGAHGRMLHVPQYAHQLGQREKNFHLLEEFVECMANNGAHVCGQVGTNWVHSGGKTPKQIKEFLDRVADTYETPLHMAGYCLVEALREIGAETIALNSVYYWPDWRDGISRFLRDAGFNLVYAGNFVDLGMYETQEQVNDQTWIFPGDMAAQSMQRLAELAPNVDAYVVNGMPNFRRADGVPQRMVSREVELEALVGKPIIASDTALYWRIFKTLGTAPVTPQGYLLSQLSNQ